MLPSARTYFICFIFVMLPFMVELTKILFQWNNWCACIIKLHSTFRKLVFLKISVFGQNQYGFGPSVSPVMRWQSVWYCFNWLWLSDVIWQYKHESILAQVMAWWWQHQAITWTNVDFLFMRLIGIYLRAIARCMPKLLFCISLKIILTIKPLI